MQCECIGTKKKTEDELILQSGHKIQGIYSEVKFQGGYGTGYRWIQAELPKNLEVLVCLRHLCVCILTPGFSNRTLAVLGSLCRLGWSLDSKATPPPPQ